MGLTLQDRDMTGHTDGCAAMKDSLNVAERSVGALTRLYIGLASQQSAQYSAVDELHTASTGALFLRARRLVDTPVPPVHVPGPTPGYRISAVGRVCF